MYYCPDKSEKYQTISEIKTSFSNVLFPPDQYIDDWMLAFIEVFVVQETEPPDPPDGKVAADGWPELVDGAWHQRWVFVDAPVAVELLPETIPEPSIGAGA